jgi:hypothetical protein
MKQPKCTVYAPSSNINRIAIRSMHFDMENLILDVQGDQFSFFRITFKNVFGFRVLDERDLCEFWKEYHLKTAWFYEVHEGGWIELEMMRQYFSTPSIYPKVREFFIVCDSCLSVLTTQEPDIDSIGSDIVG